MTTLTYTTVDTIDLDTFYNQFPNCLRIWIHENNPNTAKPTPSN
ncbi:13141_t:CDS:1, partial [Dentiscutata heterogama]